MRNPNGWFRFRSDVRSICLVGFARRDYDRSRARNRASHRRQFGSVASILILVTSALGSAGACGGKMADGGSSDDPRTTGATGYTDTDTTGYTNATVYPNTTRYPGTGSSPSATSYPSATTYTTSYPGSTTYPSTTRYPSTAGTASTSRPTSWSGTGGTRPTSVNSRGIGGASTYGSTYARGGASSAPRSSSAYPIPPECVIGQTDLLDYLQFNPSDHWISAKAPCSIEGSFSAFSDTGTDATLGTADDSLQWPRWNGTTYDNPCGLGICCFSGTTRLWPRGPEPRYDLDWGAGIRLGLSQTRGSNPNLYRYAGKGKGFRIRLLGTLEGGQTVRIGYTQVPKADPLNSPFVPYTSLGEKEVIFEDASCPSWLTDCTDTGYGGPDPYELFVMVAGGDDAGFFEVCIADLIPIE